MLSHVSSPASVCCPHAERCPGCAWITRSPADQLAAKQALLSSALAPYAMSVHVLPVQAAELNAGYRTRAKLAVAPGPRLGLFARASHDVLDLPGCPVLTPQLAAATGAGGRQLRIWLAGAPAVAPAVAPASLAAAPGSTAATPVARSVQPKHAPGRQGRDIIIAVDAGHGGEDPGAIGPGGTHEKDVTLAIARALAARRNDRPGMKAILTRDSDRRIDLRERFERARHAGADLFVSIHADSIRDRSITGASVYTLSTHGASSEAAKRLADRENATVLKGGISLADVDPDLRSVLLDASQSQIMGQSVEAADAVLSALDQVGGVRKSVVQHAGFMVLKSPDQPSMLVETAYISNPAEERNLRSGSYQQRLAEAIESGVASYFREHPPDGTSYASARGPDTRLPDDSGV